MAGIRFAPAVASAWLLLGLAPALAQAPAAPPAKEQPKPYKPVEVKLPAAYKDASFNAFRQELAKVAKGRVFADLAQLVVRRGFFWDRDFGGGFDPKKSATENLARAVSLESNDGAGWNTLAAFAAEATAARALSRPGVICSPAKPKFSEPDFFRLLVVTGTARADWRYPRAKVTAVYAAPSPRSDVIDTLGRHFVRVLHAQIETATGYGAGWVRILTPAGTVGYVSQESLTGLAPGKLCYSRDIVGRWHIAGYVGAGKP